MKTLALALLLAASPSAVDAILVMGEQMRPRLPTEVRDEVFRANMAALMARVDEEKAHALYQSRIAAKQAALGDVKATEARAAQICRAVGMNFDAAAVKCIEKKEEVKENEE